MQENLEKLGRLQEIDFKIDRAKKLVTGAPKLFADAEAKLNKEKDLLAQAQGVLTTLETQKRMLQTEITMNNDRIKNIDGRLGQVSNNKEFHAATKEAEKAKKLIQDQEKLVSDILVKIEDAVKKVQEMEARVQTMASELETKKAEVGVQIGEADKEIGSYAGDRQAIASGIDVRLVSQYNRIRTRYSEALVVIRANHCASCNVTLPPQLFNKLQRGDEIITCPSCSRILHFKMQ